MKVALPSQLGYGRLEGVIAALSQIQHSKELILDWQRTTHIAPAGFAMLACLFDSAVENQCKVTHVGLSKELYTHKVIENVSQIPSYSQLPKPWIHNMETSEFFLIGDENTLNIGLGQKFQEKFSTLIDEETLFSCLLILNELMQNSVDHSSSERYYAYAGLWENSLSHEVHVGVLDMGVSVPAKLAQKYHAADDLQFLDLALQEGITTRRIRPGGLGLYHTFEHLKQHAGTLTILSREAQIIRYLKNKKIRRSKLKHALTGTWCLARLPLSPTKRSR